MAKKKPEPYTGQEGKVIAPIYMPPEPIPEPLAIPEDIIRYSIENMPHTYPGAGIGGYAIPGSVYPPTELDPASEAYASGITGLPEVRHEAARNPAFATTPMPSMVGDISTENAINTSPIITKLQPDARPYPWDSIAKPQIKPYITDFGPTPEYSKSDEDKRVANTMKWARFLPLLSLGNPRHALAMLSAIGTSTTNAAKQAETEEYGRDKERYGISRQTGMDTNQIRQVENQQNIEGYNREVANTVRTEEFRQRAIDSAADREWKRAQAEAMTADRQERTRIEARRQQSTEKQNKLRALLSLSTSRLMSAGTERQVAKELAELLEIEGGLPANFLLSMTPEQTEKIRIASLTAEDRNRHWQAQEEEAKRQFDAKLAEDKRQFNQADATKKAVAALRSSGTGGVGGKGGLTANVQINRMADELKPLAAEIKNSREQVNRLKLDKIRALRDVDLMDNTGKDPTGLNKQGKLMVEKIDAEVKALEDKIFAAQFKYDATYQQVKGFLDANRTLATPPGYGQVPPMVNPATGSVVNPGTPPVGGGATVAPGGTAPITPFFSGGIPPITSGGSINSMLSTYGVNPNAPSAPAGSPPVGGKSKSGKTKFGRIQGQ